MKPSVFVFTQAHAGTLLWICERIRQRRRHAALVVRLWAPTSTEGVLILVQRLHCERCGQRCADQRFVRKGLREGSEHDDVESDSVPLVPSTDDEPAASNRLGDDVASLCVSCADKAKVDDSPDWETRSTFRIVRRRIRGATVHDTFDRAFQLYATERCLGTRTRSSSDDGALSKSYCWLTYADVQRWATHFGSGLRHLGVAPGEAVALCFSNRLEWVVADLALCQFGHLCVPCHTVWDASTLTHVLRGASVVAALVSPAELPTLRAAQANGNLPSLRHVIDVGDRFRHSAELQSRAMRGASPSHFASLYEDDATAATAASENVVAFDALCVAGARHPCVATPVTDASAPFQLSYTSGSTGTPKGAVLSNSAFNLKVTRAKSSACGHVNFSYEPLAHSERTNVWSALVERQAVAFYSGDVATLWEDVRVARPTLLGGVPRVWASLHAQYTRMLHQVLALAKSDARGRHLRPEHVEAIVRAKFRPRLGGRVEAITTGGAAVSDELVVWLRETFGCVVGVTYGACEASGIARTTACCTSASRRSSMRGATSRPTTRRTRAASCWCARR